MAAPKPTPLQNPAVAKLLRRLIPLGVLAMVLLIAFTSTYDYVPPFEVGIRQSKYGGGIQPEPLAGGRWYTTGPGVTIHKFPTTLQSVEFSSTESETARNSDSVRAAGRIEIDTSDGSKMHADVNVLYRISDAYKVMKEFGPGRTFESNAVIPRAQAALKENLGRLLAEDFYNEELRQKQTNAAREAMKTVLLQSGITVEHVLIRQYYYNQDYQRQIEQRKVQDQLVFTQNSRAESAKEDARRRKIVAEGEAAVDVEKRRGEAEITRIRAEADLYARKKRAEGDLLVTLATAKGTELENTSYEGTGSENMVAEQMAGTLRGMDLIILSDNGKTAFNPLDIDNLMRMFGASKGVAP